HRLAADDELVAFQLLVLLRGFNYCQVTSFQLRFRIWDAPFLFVDEVESHRILATLSQSCRSHAHEPAQLIRAGTMTEYDRHARAIILRGRIQHRRHGISFINFDCQLAGLSHDSTSELPQMVIAMQVAPAHPITFRHLREQWMTAPLEVALRVGDTTNDS